VGEKKPNTPLITKELRELKDAVDELRITVKYLHMDLEATKREMKGKQ
jgi:hypothetical protein